MNLPVLLAINVTFAAFVAGVWFCFKKVHEDTLRFYAIKIVTVCAIASANYSLIRNDPWMPVTSIALSLLGLSLFMWSWFESAKSRLTLAFSNDAPMFLINEGPYRYIRHPFYSSYILGYLSMIFATPHPLQIALALAAGGLYLEAARHEERKFARSPLRGPYKAYARSAGMFFPRLRISS